MHPREESTVTMFSCLRCHQELGTSQRRGAAGGKDGGAPPAGRGHRAGPGGDTRTAAKRCTGRGPPDPRGALRGSKAAPSLGGVTALQCYEAAVDTRSTTGVTLGDAVNAGVPRRMLPPGGGGLGVTGGGEV